MILPLPVKPYMNDPGISQGRVLTLRETQGNSVGAKRAK